VCHIFNSKTFKSFQLDNIAIETNLSSLETPENKRVSYKSNWCGGKKRDQETIISQKKNISVSKIRLLSNALVSIYAVNRKMICTHTRRCVLLAPSSSSIVSTSSRTVNRTPIGAS
jgi:hypothetical protein